MEKTTSHKDLMVLIYRITQSFPREEVYALISQMRRCASSIPANIAEGSGRRSLGEFRQFLHISLGSAAELETFLIISERLGYLNGEDKGKTIDSLNEVMRMLVGLIRKLNNK